MWRRRWSPQSLSCYYLTKIHGRFGWKERPLTLADFDSKLINIASEFLEFYRVILAKWSKILFKLYEMKNPQLHVTNIGTMTVAYSDANCAKIKYEWIWWNSRVYHRRKSRRKQLSQPVWPISLTLYGNLAMDFNFQHRDFSRLACLW